jgi:hypothetical protein
VLRLGSPAAEPPAGSVAPCGRSGLCIEGSTRVLPAAAWSTAGSSTAPTSAFAAIRTFAGVARSCLWLMLPSPGPLPPGERSGLPRAGSAPSALACWFRDPGCSAASDSRVCLGDLGGVRRGEAASAVRKAAPAAPAAGSKPPLPERASGGSVSGLPPNGPARRCCWLRCASAALAANGEEPVSAKSGAASGCPASVCPPAPAAMPWLRKPVFFTRRGGPRSAEYGEPPAATARGPLAPTDVVGIAPGPGSRAGSNTGDPSS